MLTFVGQKGRHCVSLCCHAARAGVLRHTATTQISRRRTTLTAAAAASFHSDRSSQFPNTKKMANAFEEHGVVPDVIDVAPESNAEVVYPSGVKVELGNVLTPTQVKDPPNVTWPTEPGAKYSLIMTDPDAPSRADPKYREWHHWLVGNISGSDVASGEVLSGYVGSGPPKGTGLHRYCFLVYKQAGKIDFTEKRLPQTSMDGRPNFKARDFAARHNLGNPVAGNFYQAEWDDYVPKLYEQLSGK